MIQTLAEMRYEMHYETMGRIYNSRIQEITYMKSLYKAKTIKNYSIILMLHSFKFSYLDIGGFIFPMI